MTGHDRLFGTIVVGCDGGERGRGAVSLAHAIASASAARLLLVGVHHTPPLPYPDTYRAQRGRLEHDLRALRDELAPEADVRIVVDLSPAHALRHLAESEGADLLVVGSRHRRRLQRIVEGDCAMQVLHGASCAVAVAPDPVAPRPQLRRIGVGVDDGAESALALTIARTLAERCGAELWLTTVVEDAIPVWLDVPPASSASERLSEIMTERLSAGHELLDARLDECAGVAAHGEVLVGDPAGELILASERWDLLVLGSRRWGALRRLALGSTSERVIRHAACPVLVPPRGIGEGDPRSTAPDDATDVEHAR